jgi:hypothetical protein
VIVLAATAILIAVGALVASVGTRSVERPEGVAERWLRAVGDTTRTGVSADARRRASGHGDPALIPALVPPGQSYNGSDAFTAYEVGHASRSAAGSARVPVRLTHRSGPAGTEHVALVLHETEGSWRVLAVDPPDRVLRVPSEGGPPVSRAPMTLYLCALMIVIASGGVCSLLLRLAERSPVAAQGP